jgi:DNA-binding GntR family transcriptional regulator
MTSEDTPRAEPRAHGEAGARVARSLRQEILDGSYRPGERIRQDELAVRLGASRLPVREALRMLEAEGMVTIVPNAGSWVARLSPDDCNELYQIRERVEPLLLRYGIPTLGEDLIDTLQAQADAMADTPDVERFLRLDREFHLLSYSTATTTVLGETILGLWNRTQHYRRAYTRLFYSLADRSVHYEHQLLVQALRNRDADDAERVLTGHIRRTRLELIRHPEVFAE